MLSLPLLLISSLPTLAQAPEHAAPHLADPDLDEATRATSLPESPPLAEPDPEGITLVYTGALGGVGSGLYPLDIVQSLREADDDLSGSIAELTVYHGVLAQGDVSIHADDGRVQTLLDGLTGDGPTCGAAHPVTAVRTPTEVLALSTDAHPAMVQALTERGASHVDWTTRACEGPNGEALTLQAPPDAVIPPWAVEKWEIRRALKGRLIEADGAGQAFTITATPVQEASRMYALARMLMETHPGALYVDAGSYLDGVSSVRDNALSLHRPLTWRMLEQLKPSALVPGETELIRGWTAFSREHASHSALPYLASNLTWTEDRQGAIGSDPCQSPQHPLPRCRVIDADADGRAVRLAFVGILDPDLGALIPELAQDGVEITDPVDGIQDVVDALYQMDDPPSTVIALTTASGERLAQVRRSLHGVDIVAGDPTFATFRIEQRAVTLRDLPPERKGAPLTLPMDGLATAKLVFDEDGHLTQVTSQPRLVQGDLPRDPIVAAAITHTRMNVYPTLDRELIPPADSDAPALSWPARDWAQLVCEAVREATQADVVMLRELPAPTTLPGPLTELLVVDQLAVLDTLELHRIPGDKLGAVLDKAWGAVPTTCGATSSSSPKARGRSLEADRTYRLVTTDRTREATIVGELLDGVPASGVLDPTGVVPLMEAEGYPRTLRAATLDTMRRLRAQDDQLQHIVEYLQDEAPGAKPTQWVFRLGEATFAIDQFHGTDNAAFGEVPETLATSPSSLTLSGTTDTAIERSGSDMTWDLGWSATYSKLKTVEDKQEVADDWKASTSLELPAAGFPKGGLVVWDPYTELLYDSEFTPTEDETGAENPMQSDLFLTFGLSAEKTGALKTLRLGAFANRDLTRFDEKPFEFGARFELETSKKLASWMKWSTTIDAYVWGNTPDDDASDLRFQALGKTSLGMPLARWLDIDLYGQGYALQGRVPETQDLGFAWTLGAALDAAGAWQL